MKTTRWLTYLLKVREVAPIVVKPVDGGGTLSEATLTPTPARASASSHRSAISLPRSPTAPGICDSGAVSLAKLAAHLAMTVWCPRQDSYLTRIR